MLVDLLVWMFDDAPVTPARAILSDSLVDETVDVGNIVVLSVQFVDLNGTLFDPPTVVLKVKDPARVVTEYTMTRDSVGKYHYNLLVEQSDRWYWRVEGQAASLDFVSGDANFMVTESPVLGC